MVAPDNDVLLFIDEPRLMAVEFPVTFVGENDTQIISVAPNANASAAISAICASFYGEGSSTASQCGAELTANWPSMSRRPCYTNVAKADLSLHPLLRKYVSSTSTCDQGWD
jgi:hypothetical protein